MSQSMRVKKILKILKFVLNTPNGKLTSFLLIEFTKLRKLNDFG